MLLKPTIGKVIGSIFLYFLFFIGILRLYGVLHCLPDSNPQPASEYCIYIYYLKYLFLVPFLIVVIFYLTYSYFQKRNAVE